MNLDSMAVMVTAWRRPEYLERTLDSWSRSRGIGEVRKMTVALGWADRQVFDRQAEVIDAAKRSLGCKVLIKPDSTAARNARGMGTAIGEAVSALFMDPGVQFAVCGEEDVAISSDTLEYFSWAASEFRHDPKVLAVCAHTPAGQSWDEPGAGLREDPDADPEAVQLIPRFSPWVWGTWRDRWERTLRPGWDWACDKGDAMTSGYDWEIMRIIQRGGYVTAMPLASRSQNIGRDGGWAADPAHFEATQSASFRELRAVCAYQVVVEEAQAA